MPLLTPALLHAFQPPSVQDLDLYKDTPVRYLGYANELGESFRPLAPPGFVAATYAVSFGYVFMDMQDKARKEHAVSVAALRC